MIEGEDDRERAADAAADRALWRRSRDADAPADEAAHFLDLAAYAEGRLDTDDDARVAALIAADPTAAGDVEAARALAAAVAPPPPGLERIVARAVRLVAKTPERRVIPFAPARRRPLYAVAQWASLAAAIVFASWLGFAMGSDFSHAYSNSQAEQAIGDEGYMPELLDPSTGFMRELAEDLQT